MTPTQSRTDGSTSVGAKTGRPLVKIAIGICALAAFILLGRLAGGFIQPFAQWVDGLGLWGPLVFGLAYAAAVVAFVPASLLTLGAGATRTFKITVEIIENFS